MRAKGLIALAAAAVIGGAYLAGYLPERRGRIAVEAEIGALRPRLAAAEARVRTGELLGQALTLKEVAMRQNYGQALELSTSFFDAVRAELARPGESGLADGLNEVLTMRDGVTAALAKADPTVLETLQRVELRLRRALGYALPAGIKTAPSIPQ